MTQFFTVDGDEMAFTHCVSCGIRYGMPATLYREHQKNGGYHECPNGHSQGWDKEKENEVANLKEQVARIKRSAELSRHRAESAERSIRAYKGTVTRLKRKADQPVKFRSIKGGKDD